MSPSSLPGRRLLSSADPATFAPPLPPEAFGWRRPGPAILKFEGYSDTINPLAPVVRPGLTPAKDSKGATVLGKGSNAASTPVKGANAALTPIKGASAASTPVKSPRAASAPVRGVKPPSTPVKGSYDVTSPRRDSSEASTSSPEPVDRSQWRRWQDLPSQAMPREALSQVIGMKDDPRSAYRYKRTCGPPIDYPSEDAGPIADRRRVDAPAITISNTYGNLRIHVVSADKVQVWYLGKTSDKTAAWIEAQAGDPHPDSEALPNIVLSTAKPYQPRWIREASFDTQKYPSRMVARMTRVKPEPY